MDRRQFLASAAVAAAAGGGDVWRPTGEYRLRWLKPDGRIKTVYWEELEQGDYIHVTDLEMWFVNPWQRVYLEKDRRAFIVIKEPQHRGPAVVQWISETEFENEQAWREILENRRLRDAGELAR